MLIAMEYYSMLGRTIVILWSLIYTTGSAMNDTKKCRNRHGYFPVEEFNLRTCAECYGYLFRDGKTLRQHRTFLIEVNDTTGLAERVLIPDIHDPISAGQVCETLDEDECNRWRFCCVSAAICCIEQPEVVVESPGHCPMTWDGFACWKSSPAGQELSLSCPAYIPHAMPSVNAYKSCTDNATWYKDPDTGMEWTKYTTCLDLERFKTEVYISVACNAASIILLLPSLAIFVSYSLQVRPFTQCGVDPHHGSLRKQHRIRIHVQMFFSFLLTAVINIMWETLVVYDRMTLPSTETRMHQNTIMCRLLYVATRYTRSTNFLWMFLEGFYLHRLIVKVFKPPESLLCFYLLGWGFPTIPVSIYSALKADDADESCWIKNFGAWEWLIYMPNLISLVTNFFFLADILRILLTRLQAHPNEPSNYRRAIKATAILIPLFGLQLFTIIYRPPATTPGAKEYEYVAAFVANSQGFFVALIFCFMNNEVIASIKTCFKIRRRPANGRLRNRNSLTTQMSEYYRDNLYVKNSLHRNTPRSSRGSLSTSLSVGSRSSINNKVYIPMNSLRHHRYCIPEIR